MLNVSSGKKERMGRLLRMHANHREDVEDVFTGDIIAAVGLKNTKTGETLAAIDKPIQLESMTFPAPVISVAIEPKTKADQDKLGDGLGRLAQEDRRSSSAPTTRPARRSSPGWVSSISTCSSIASVVSSRWTPTSVALRWPTARPSRRRSKASRTSTSSRPAARASTGTW